MLPRLVSLKCTGEVKYLQKILHNTLCKLNIDECWGCLSESAMIFLGLGIFYLHPYSLLWEDLQFRPVIGHISEELLLIAIPLDAVQGVAIHVKPGNENFHL